MNFLFKVRRVPVYCMMLVVIGLSTIPPEWIGAIMEYVFGPQKHEPSTLPMDKIMHFSLYTVLGFSAAWAVSIHKWDENPRRYFAWVVVLAGGYGVLDECYQLLSGLGRQFEVADMFADLLGATTGAVVFIWKGLTLKKRFKRYLITKNAYSEPVSS